MRLEKVKISKLNSKIIFLITITSMIAINMKTDTFQARYSAKNDSFPTPIQIKRFGNIKSPQATTLNIYTYGSLINYGENGGNIVRIKAISIII